MSASLTPAGKFGGDGYDAVAIRFSNYISGGCSYGSAGPDVSYLLSGRSQRLIDREAVFVGDVDGDGMGDFGLVVGGSTQIKSGRTDTLILSLLPLQSIGVPDCTLWTAPFVGFVETTDAHGRASLSLSLAASALPPGVEFSAQWVAFDPLLNALGVHLSDALRFRIGN